MPKEWTENSRRKNVPYDRFLSLVQNTYQGNNQISSVTAILDDGAHEVKIQYNPDSPGESGDPTSRLGELIISSRPKTLEDSTEE